jgi:hypothetical protein
VSERTWMRQVKLVALLSHDRRSLLAFAMVQGIQEWESLHIEAMNHYLRLVHAMEAI